MVKPSGRSQSRIVKARSRIVKYRSRIVKYRSRIVKAKTRIVKVVEAEERRERCGQVSGGGRAKRVASGTMLYTSRGGQTQHEETRPFIRDVQGCLAHKKTPNTLAPP